MNKAFRFIFLWAIACLSTPCSQADPFINFQSFDTSLYTFSANKVDPYKTVSPVIESWGDYSIGDMYFYGIWQRSLQHDYAGDTSTYYYKAVPRLSLAKNINKDISYGIFKDASAALWVSRTKGDKYSYFPGLALDWQIPGLAWLRTIYYYENNYHQGWNDRRLHIDYAYPFSTSSGNFRIVGTFDMTFGQGDNPVMFDFKPELHYDLGQALGYQPGHLWIGGVIEPIKNKYKIENSPGYRTNQFSYGLMIRYSYAYFPH